MRFFTSSRMTTALLTLGCLVALTSVFHALPGLNYGVWFQSEPVIHANLAGALLAALGLLGHVFFSSPLEGEAGRGVGSTHSISECVERTPHPTLSPVRRGLYLLHPVILLPVAIAAWSALVSPFAIHPSLSWLGSPELGEGVIFWLQLAVLTAAMRVLLESEAARRVLITIAVSICALLTILYALPALEAYRPYAFADHIAFYALCLPVLFTTPKARAAAWLFAGGMIALSGNRLALLLLAGVPPFYLLLHFRPRLTERLAYAAMVVLPLALLLAAVVLGGESEGSSLWSRLRLWEIARHAFADQPAALLTGFGWGHYSELSLRYLLLDGVKMWGVDGSLTPNWEGLAQLHFHSHNFLTEALLSGGIVAALLVWGWLLALARYGTRSALIFPVLLAGMLSGWFQLPGSWPFTALAVACMIHGSNASFRLPHRAMYLLPVLCITGAVAALITQAGWTIRARTLMDGHSTLPCTAQLGDAAIGSAYTAQIAHGWMATTQLSQQAALSPQTQEQAREYLCMFKRDAAGSIRLALLDVILHTELAYMPENNALKAEAETGWQDSLDSLLNTAPHRTDMAIPYLLHLMHTRREQQALAFAEALHKRDADDPVALWFMGNVLLGDDETAVQGFTYLRQSVALGIERLMPVPKNILKQIQNVEF